MEMNVVKSSKDELEIEFENATLAEILRVYLNKDSGVTFAAWKKENTKDNPLLRVTTKGKTAKKAVNDAVSAIVKDLDKVESDFKKLK